MIVRGGEREKKGKRERRERDDEMEKWEEYQSKFDGIDEFKWKQREGERERTECD